MSTPSTIDRMPDDIRLQLQMLLQDPRVSILDATAQINAILEEEGHEDRLSKSAVGRASQRWKRINDRIKQTREIGEMFIAKVGAAPQGQTGLAINEILRTMACELSEKLLDADLENPETMSATIDQVKSLALTVQRLESATTNNVKREDVIRKQEREKALQEATDAIKDATSKAPIDGNFQFDPKTIDYVTTVLYGLKPK